MNVDYRKQLDLCIICTPDFQSNFTVKNSTYCIQSFMVVWSDRENVCIHTVNPLRPTVAAWLQLYKALCAIHGQAVVCNF